MKPTPDEIEEKRLRKVLANKQASAFELEDAQQRLAALTERRDPKCQHCEKPTSTHNEAKCPILARFQQRHGRGSIPTAGQAAELRARLAADEIAKSRADAKRAAKGGQGSLF